MKRTGMIGLLLLALLAACGSAPTSAPVAAPTDVPTAAPTVTAPSPSALTQTVLDMLAARDERGVRSVFDPEMNDFLRAATTTSALNAWHSFKQKVPQDITIQPEQPAPNGQVIVPVLTTFATPGTPSDMTVLRWEFVYRAMPAGWRMTDIVVTQLEAP